MRKPTEKQRRFIKAYLGEANGNATKAARIAGYRLPHEQGRQQLRKSIVSAAVNAAVARAEMETAEVLARLSEHASGDMENFIAVNDDGTFRIDLAKAKKAGKTRLIRGVKAWRTTSENVVIETVELELHSSVKALDLLARHHGLYQRNECPNQQPKRPRILLPSS